MKSYALIAILTLSSSVVLAEDMAEHEGHTPPVTPTETVQAVSVKPLTQMEIMQTMMKTMQEMSAKMAIVADKIEGKHDMNADPAQKQKQKMHKLKMQMQEHLGKAKQAKDPSKRKQHMQKHMKKMQEMMASMKMAKMDKSYSQSDSEPQGDKAEGGNMMKMMKKKMKDKMKSKMKSKHRKEVDQRLDNIETLLGQLLEHQAANTK